MNIGAKVRERFENHIAELIVTALIAAVVFGIGLAVPAIWPDLESAIKEKVPSTAFLGLCVALAALNTLTLILLWPKKSPAEQPALNLVAGVYWDRKGNPHCPTCNVPLGGYADYGWQGNGYRCSKCRDVFGLTDRMGAQLRPDEVLQELVRDGLID